MEEHDLETELEAAVDADVTVARDRDERVRNGRVRFTVYCEDETADRIREQLADAATDVAFETRR